MPQELKAQDVCLALPHLLLGVDVLVQHGKFGDPLVAPQFKAPFWMLSQILDAECVDPQARRLPGADPDLVDNLRDCSNAAERLQVLLALVPPQSSIIFWHCTLTPIPMIVLPNRINLQHRVLLQDSLKILVLGPQLSNGLGRSCAKVIAATEHRVAGTVVEESRGSLGVDVIILAGLQKLCLHLDARLYRLQLCPKRISSLLQILESRRACRSRALHHSVSRLHRHDPASHRSRNS
mmetsp:Transcript_52430/g.170217  ORF Transcript_52430/g.170217 Transcript_52430/m.170217 type:complete len:237 (+) Transcript_52430:2100-2810(+)